MPRKSKPKKKKPLLAQLKSNMLIFSSLLFTGLFIVLIAIVNQYRTIPGNLESFARSTNPTGYITYNDTTVAIKNTIGKNCYIRQPYFLSSLRTTQTGNPSKEKFAFNLISRDEEKEYVFDQDVIALTTDTKENVVSVKPNNVLKIKRGVAENDTDFFIIERTTQTRTPAISNNDEVQFKSLKT